jgi:hypothetical protein
MSTLIRTARIALSVAALAACSFGHAATAVKAPAPVAATRTAPVAVKNVTPDDGAQRVDVLDQVKITFDGAIDPASITRAHVVLTSWGVPVGSSMSYDDTTHRITLKPIDIHGGLVHGTTYTLKISGLVDSFGRAVTPFQSSFSTWLNPARSDKQVDHDPESGAIDWHGKSFFDGDGHLVRLVGYSGAGADGKWGTADDVVNSYSRYDLRPDGLMSGEHDYYEPGADGIWFTADDVLSNYATQTYTPAGAPLVWTWHYVDPQAEACCATSYAYGYDDSGVLVSTTDRNPGPDGILGTADDDIYGQTEDHDALGRWVGSTNSHAGVVTSYVVRTWRSDSRIDCTTSYSLGADGLPHTADDTITSIHTYTYDKRGNVIRYTRWFDAGPDGVWRTADDTPIAYTRYWYDDNDNLVKSIAYEGPGRDGVWFTDDDQQQDLALFDTSR